LKEKEGRTDPKLRRGSINDPKRDLWVKLPIGKSKRRARHFFRRKGKHENRKKSKQKKEEMVKTGKKGWFLRTLYNKDLE